MATAPSMASTVLGVVLLVHNGDRSALFQDPHTYVASEANITPFGNLEAQRAGSDLRQIYLNSSSSSFVSRVGSGLVNVNQIEVRADAGDGGGVMYDSAVSLLQGLFPPTPANNMTLSNGTNVTAPLGGYQYVPIESVEPDQDLSLESWIDCDPFNQATSEFYNSSAFQETSKQAQPFLNQLGAFVPGQPLNLVNIWNVFDYMNVQLIHNETYAQSLPSGYLAQARALANFHEYGVFTSPTSDGIGNIGGRTILPSIMEAMTKIANSSDPLKLSIQAISYKPFLSLFNMTQVAQTYPQLAATVDYAAVAAYEVRQPVNGGDPVVRFNFKNGTANGTDTTDFTTYNMLGNSGDTPLSQFISTFEPVVINSTQQWCTVCANTQTRGCNVFASLDSQSHHDRISPIGAGFLGAGLAIVLMLFMFAVLAFLGIITIRKKFWRRGSKHQQQHKQSQTGQTPRRSRSKSPPPLSEYEGARLEKGVGEGASEEYGLGLGLSLGGRREEVVSETYVPSVRQSSVRHSTAPSDYIIFPVH